MPGEWRTSRRTDILVYSSLCAVILSLGVSPVRAQTADPLQQLYRDAVTAEQRADYDTAARLYGKIIAARPDLAEAHANLGNLLYVQSRFEEARRSFETAAKLKPQLAGPHFFLGVLALRANDTTAAEAQLRRAAALEPANPQIRLHLGYVHYARAQYDEAIQSFEKTLAADESNEDAWYHLSKVCSQQSRRYFDLLQQGQADSRYTHLARAHFFEAQGNWQEAAQEYTKAAQPASEPALLARIQWVEARAAGKEAPFVSSGDEIDGSTVFLHNPPALSELAPLYRKWRAAAGIAQRSSTPASAETLYRRAEAYQLLSYLASMWVYANAPESYRAYQLKGQAFEASGRNEEAIAQYRKALGKNPQLRSVHFAIGNLYWRNAAFDEALTELEAELALNPNDPETHYEIGDILFTQNKLDEASAHFLTCLKFAPDTVEAHLALERIYNANGNSEKALFHLSQAARIAPAEATPHYRLWLLYRKQGKTAEAEREREIFQKLKQQGKGSVSVDK